MNVNPCICIVAGDPSADFPGKNLISEITRACPEMKLFGLGGPQMQEAGLEALADYRELAVLGFWEVLPRFFFFRRLLARMADMIEKRKPRAVILIDYPGFNLRLAKRIKRLGIPIIYYISPQVWAWGKGRIAQIKRLIDLMLVIFPFEKEFYQQHGVAVEFTGHPIHDRYQNIPDKQSCRRQLHLSDEKKTIALLPGSRTQEVKRMLPEMIRAIDRIKSRIPQTEFIIAGVENIAKDIYDSIIGDSTIPVLIGETPELLSGCDFVITSSGTATIEAAYFTNPMVIIYRTGFLTYHIAKRLVTLDAIGMVNIVAGKHIVPELIQHDAGAEAIAYYTCEILENPDMYDRIVNDLENVKTRLYCGGSGRQAFDAIHEMVGLC